MKERELRAHAICSLCRKKILEGGLPLFYRLTIERFGVKFDAIRRQAGLEMMLDNHVAIAQAMGPDEDMTMSMMEKLTLVVCETCSTNMEPCCVARLAATESTVKAPA